MSIPSENFASAARASASAHLSRSSAASSRAPPATPATKSRKLRTTPMGGTDREHRILVFAPIGRDGRASAELLRSATLETIVCPDLAALISEIAAGAAAVLLAEEGLFGKDTAPLTQWIDRQPAWSDLPF